MSINGLMDGHKFQLHLISFHSSGTGQKSDNTQPQSVRNYVNKYLKYLAPPFLVTNLNLVNFDDVMADLTLTFKTQLITLIGAWSELDIVKIESAKYSRRT